MTGILLFMGFVVNSMVKKIRISGLSIFLILIFTFIIFSFSGIRAYGGDNPLLGGHSGDEILVTVGGVSQTLNEALDSIEEDGRMHCVEVTDSSHSSGWPGTTGPNPLISDCGAVLEAEGYRVVAGACRDLNLANGAGDPKWDKPILDTDGRIKWQCLGYNWDGEHYIINSLTCCK